MADEPANASPAPPPDPERLAPSHRYVIGLVRRGKSPPPASQEEADRLQAGHLAYLQRLEQAGELIIDGTFEEAGELLGALLFRNGPVDRLRELCEHDPAVVRGRLTIDFHTWTAHDGLRIGRPPEPEPDEPE